MWTADPESVAAAWLPGCPVARGWFYSKTSGFSILFGLFACKTTGFSTFWSEHVQNHCYVNIFWRKHSKTNGFSITPLQKDPKQQELRTHVRPRWIKDPKKVSKSIGFIDRATEIVEKPLVLQAKRPKDIEKPLVLQATSHQPPTTDSGSAFQILAWMSYEEPLQPSCLGFFWS